LFILRGHEDELSVLLLFDEHAEDADLRITALAPAHARPADSLRFESRFCRLETASRIREALEEAMLANPVHWQKHYGGSPQRQKFARAYSFSDRIRYYWNVPSVQAAFERLLRNLEQTPPPLSLLSQYLPQEYEQVRAGIISPQPRALLMARVTRTLETYRLACEG